MFIFETVTIDVEGHVIKKYKRRVESRQDWLALGVGLDMIAIPGGRFMMGSPKAEAGKNWYQVWDQTLDGLDIEGPQHLVNIPDFWMGQYLVTQSQWRTVAALPVVDRELDPNPADFKGDRHPVEQVSWNDAIEFCQRLSAYTNRSYRLPSEAEWEYACRAGTSTPFSCGPTITPELANYAPVAGEHNGVQWSGAYGLGPKGQYRQQTTAVGTFHANAFGLYDVHGNVWEWCLDHWHNTYEGAPSDGSAWVSSDPNSLRVLRGGTWFFFPDLCRSAFRNRRAPDTRFNRTGFRVVCEP